jgi:serine/threonine protein kinase
MEYCGAGSVADLCDLLQQPLNEDQIKYVIRETLKVCSHIHNL